MFHPLMQDVGKSLMLNFTPIMVRIADQHSNDLCFHLFLHKKQLPLVQNFFNVGGLVPEHRPTHNSLNS